MTLEKLLEVVSDAQEVKLISDDFGELNGSAAGLASALSKDIMTITVIEIEAEYDGNLKVWVEDERLK